MELKNITKNLKLFFILFLLILGIYYLFLASNTNFLGDDEFTYYYSGKIISEGSFPIFNIWKYPMSFYGLSVTLFYSFLFFIFGPSLEITKMISVFFGFLTIFVIYMTGKKISIFYGILSSMIILSVQLFTHFMFLSYMDLPTAFFSALIFYLILDLNNYKKSIFTGIILGLSYYVKSSTIIIAIFLLSLSFFKFFKEKNKQYIKLTLITLFTSALVLSPYIIRNLILFGYPYFDILNFFFKDLAFYSATINQPDWILNLVTTISPIRISLDLFVSSIGWLLLILSIFGFSWLTNYNILDRKQKDLLINLFLFVLIFLLIFFISYITGIFALESRHLFLIFPQLALVSGFFLWKLKEKNKWLIIFIIPILLFSFYTSIVIAQQTEASQRFPDDYLEALKWIKSNTLKDDFIFTTYWGPLGYYAERFSIWTHSPCLWNEFPEIMTTNNGSYINNILKKCNVSYILIWRNTVAQDYVIPESNIWGLFTYNFVNTISADTEHFEMVFSNQNNWIFKLK